METPVTQEDASGLPGWVVLAGMVVGLLIAGIIMANVLRPLYNLVFPGEAKAPIPAGAVELDYIDDSSFSDGEWLYGTTLSGCELVRFMQENDSTCTVTPLACRETNQAITDTAGQAASIGLQRIASCEGTHEAVVASYSWLVDISSGYDDEYPTRFRVYLFKERD